MAGIWNTKEEKRAATRTIIIHAALLLVFIFFGFTELDPKPEDGIVINFGTSATGSGTNAKQPSQSQPKNTQQNVEQTQPEQVTEETTPTSNLTQDVVEAPTIEKKTNTTPKKTEEPKKEEPKPSNKLSQLLDNVKNSEEGGEGVTGGPGDQGDPNGDKNSTNRTGGGGGGGGNGNYLLGNRQALSKPRPTYECDGEGRVVVKIYVDRNGKVINAVPGERVPGGAATTTTSSCLYDKAKSAAMRTTWQADSEAPSTQIGYIIYKFSKN